jgi:hypothetical protein
VLRQVRGDGGLEVDYETLVARNGARPGIIVGKQLIVGVVKALSRIGARHQIVMLIGGGNPVDLHLPAQIVRIPFLPGEPVEILAAGERFPVSA